MFLCFIFFRVLGIALWKQSCESGYDNTEKVSHFLTLKMFAFCGIETVTIFLFMEYFCLHSLPF